MTRDRESPGTEESTGAKVDGTAAEVDRSTVPQQLAQRRDAARRLEPLHCGYADPDRQLAEPPHPRNLGAARDAWRHLRCHGLLDNDEWLTDLLAGRGER